MSLSGALYICHYTAIDETLINGLLCNIVFIQHYWRTGELLLIRRSVVVTDVLIL